MNRLVLICLLAHSYNSNADSSDVAEDLDNEVLKAYSLSQDAIDEIAREIRKPRAPTRPDDEASGYMRNMETPGFAPRHRHLPAASDILVETSQRIPRMSNQGYQLNPMGSSFCMRDRSPRSFQYQQTSGWQQPLLEDPAMLQQGLYPSSYLTNQGVPSFEAATHKYRGDQANGWGKSAMYTPEVRNPYHDVHKPMQRELEILPLSRHSQDHPCQILYSDTDEEATKQYTMTDLKSSAPTMLSQQRGVFPDPQQQVLYYSKTLPMEQWEAPSIINHSQKPALVNHAQNPVIINHSPMSDCSEDLSLTPILKSPSNFQATLNAPNVREANSGLVAGQSWLFVDDLEPQQKLKLEPQPGLELQPSFPTTYSSVNAINKFGPYQMNDKGLVGQENYF